MSERSRELAKKTFRLATECRHEKPGSTPKSSALVKAGADALALPESEYRIYIAALDEEMAKRGFAVPERKEAVG
jgi:hypothetical protein